MNKVQQDVLTYCLRCAYLGKKVISVFDIIYQTGYHYDKLEKILNELEKSGHLKRLDIKTVEYIGDLNNVTEPVSDPNEALKQRMEYLEQRRRELLRKMKRLEEEDD